MIEREAISLPHNIEARHLAKPLSTVLRLNAIQDRLDILSANLTNAINYPPSEAPGFNLYSETAKEIHYVVEGAALAARFIPEIWQKAEKWRAENNTDFGFFNSQHLLVPITIDEMAKRCRQAETLDFAVENLKLTAGDVLDFMVDQWESEYESKLANIHSLTPEQVKAAKEFSRYQTVMQKGLSKVGIRKNFEAATSPGGHIKGGLHTAEQVVWGLLKVLPDVYQKQFNIAPSKRDLENLAAGTRSLVMAMARSHADIFNILKRELQKQKDGDFAAEKFYIAPQGDQLVLEIEPEVLDSVETYTFAMFADKPHTGCPALFLKVGKGKNAIIEMHGLFTRLYRQYCISNLDKFKS